MKKIIIIIAALFLLYLAFDAYKSRLQERANNFVESNETYERQRIQDFLSQ